MSTDTGKEDGFVKHDTGKPTFNYICGLVDQLGTVDAVLGYGATKYERDNWKLGKSPEAIRRNKNAAIRHVMASLDGTDLDHESGLPHVAHAIADLLFVLYHDQRPLQE